MKPEDVLSKPLLDLFKSVERVPAEMHKCKTLYEAVRVSRRLRWSLPIKRLGAVSIWATAALTQDEWGRRHMNRLVAQEVDAERWALQIGGAVHAAMVELDRLEAHKTRSSIKDRKRAFLQHQAAAVRALQGFYPVSTDCWVKSLKA